MWSKRIEQVFYVWGMYINQWRNNLYKLYKYNNKIYYINIIRILEILTIFKYQNNQYQNNIVLFQNYPFYNYMQASTMYINVNRFFNY